MWNSSLLAKIMNTTLGRWIAGKTAESVKNTWPPEILAAIGRFPDFPDQAMLRSGYGADAPRESLD